MVKKETDGSGVDVILDMVGGDYIQRNMSAAPCGAASSTSPIRAACRPRVNFAPVLTKRLSLLATTLRARSPHEKGAIRDALLREVWPLIGPGRIKPGGGQRLSPGRGPASP